MIARVGTLILLAVVAFAQQTIDTNTAAIAGIVRDKVTGKPLANYTVSTFTNVTWQQGTVFQTPATKQVSSTSDSSGRYRIPNLTPGLYRLDARDAQRFGRQLQRRVTLAGHDLDNIDFEVLIEGTVKGRVVDEYKEPVPGLSVRLVGREYYYGGPSYFYRGNATTDDRGEFTFTQVEPGVPLLVLVERSLRNPAALSEVPLDPKLRKRVPMRTWYPNSPAPESAEPLTLRPGETREGIEIEARKSPSLCLEGIAQGPNGPGTASVFMEATQPSGGFSHGLSSVGLPLGPVTAADGKFRICDLTPGVYRMSVSQGSMFSNAQQAPNFSVTQVVIADQDIRGFRATAAQATPFEGELAWATDPPSSTAAPPKVNVSLGSMYRGSLPMERSGGRFDIPGPFTFNALFQDDYTLRIVVTTPGLYIKDAIYGGRSVLYEPIRPGNSTGGGLRVNLGHDGGVISAQVRDKDGNPAGNVGVFMMPKEVASEALLAEVMVRGVTDQQGLYMSHTLAPGKYYVVATTSTVDYRPDTIAALWRSRTRFKEVDLGPNGSAQAVIEPIRLEQ